MSYSYAYDKQTDVLYVREDDAAVGVTDIRTVEIRSGVLLKFNKANNECIGATIMNASKLKPDKQKNLPIKKFLPKPYKSKNPLKKKKICP